MTSKLAAKTAKPKMSALHSGQTRWAYLIEELYALMVMYVSGIGWYYYDGTRWVEDTDGVKVRELLRALLRKARGAEKSPDKDLLREIVDCERASGVNGVLAIASTLPGLHKTVDDLDADPNLLNVSNGTVDLLTDDLRKHDPRDYCTKKAGAAYDPDAVSETWEKFLETSLPDPEVREFIQRYAGYGLSGRVTEHILVILFGEGRNGKSVFYEALTYAMGSYAGTGEPELFLDRRGGHPTGEMDLRGLRIVTVSETGQGAEFAAATLKRLVGGDRIKARRMRKDFVEFVPSHTALMVTNFLPKVRQDDPALWARLRVVGFEVVIPEADRIKDLPQQLELDADAVLAWMLAGRRDYLARGSNLDAPQAVLRATDGYRLAEDAVTQFLEQVADKDAGEKALFSTMFQRWTVWADRNSFPPLGKTDFRRALEARGVTVKVSTGKQNFVFGYSLPTKLTLPVDGS